MPKRYKFVFVALLFVAVKGHAQGERLLNKRAALHPSRVTQQINSANASANSEPRIKPLDDNKWDELPVLRLLHLSVEASRSDYLTAFARLAEQARQGQANPMGSLAYYYELVAQNYSGKHENSQRQAAYANARKWYIRAAIKGDTVAAVNLGSLLETNNGGPPDPCAALKWTMKAAEYGDISGMVNLGKSYLGNVCTGIKGRDVEKACMWLYRAAMAGQRPGISRAEYYQAEWAYRQAQEFKWCGNSPLPPLPPAPTR